MVLRSGMEADVRNKSGGGSDEKVKVRDQGVLLVLRCCFASLTQYPLSLGD